MLDPNILVWERDMLHLFHFDYSCASLIHVEYSCLAAMFAVSSKFLYVSCVELSVFFGRKYSLASLIFVWRVVQISLLVFGWTRKCAIHVVVV